MNETHTCAPFSSVQSQKSSGLWPVCSHSLYDGQFNFTCVINGSARSAGHVCYVSFPLKHNRSHTHTHMHTHTGIWASLIGRVLVTLKEMWHLKSWLETGCMFGLHWSLGCVYGCPDHRKIRENKDNLQYIGQQNSPDIFKSSLQSLDG